MFVKQIEKGQKSPFSLFGMKWEQTTCYAGEFPDALAFFCNKSTKRIVAKKKKRCHAEERSELSIFPVSKLSYIPVRS